jgi:hypothetical protein
MFCLILSLTSDNAIELNSDQKSYQLTDQNGLLNSISGFPKCGIFNGKMLRLMNI